MPKILSLLKHRITSERWDVLFGQMICFATALGTLACVGRLTRMFAATRFEVLAIILMTCTLSMAMVILGLCLARNDRHA